MIPRPAHSVTHAALLRAVNLGGHNKVPMAALRDAAGDAGLVNPRTLLQSGNLVFDDPKARAAHQLERLLEQVLHDALGISTEVFVRGARDLSRIIASNPFPAQAASDPSHLVVSFHREPHVAADVRALQDAIPGREQVKSQGRELYIVYPDGIGRSRLTPALAAKHIRSPGTARNWNTVLKLDAMLRGG